MDKARKKMNIPILQPVVDHISDFLGMINAVAKGKYKVSVQVIITSVAAILYLISVFDLVPDFIPAVGLLDDIAIVSAAASVCGHDLAKYRKWRDRKKGME